MTTKSIPYTLEQNTPPGGGTWSNLNVIADGSEFDVADGSMTKRYAWMVKPKRGRKAKLVESDQLSDIGPDDVLIWINHDGQVRSALDPVTLLIDAQVPSAPPRVGPALRVLRESTGLTLREFCARAGFDHGFVSRVERDVFRPKASWLETYLETAGEVLSEKNAAKL